MDFEGIFKEHLKPFEAKYDEARDIATGLWREYSAMSNRLDLLPHDSGEYRSSTRNATRQRRGMTKPTRA